MIFIYIALGVLSLYAAKLVRDIYLMISVNGVYVTLKQGIEVDNIEFGKVYKVLSEESGLLCRRRYLVENKDGLLVNLCSHQIDLVNKDGIEIKG